MQRLASVASQHVEFTDSVDEEVRRQKLSGNQITLENNNAKWEGGFQFVVQLINDSK